jgi:hypothetical protein
MEEKPMTVKPLPGYMIVKLESLYKDTGLIKVPERYKKARHLIGRIVALNMRAVDYHTLGIELEAGQRIIVTPLGGRRLEENTWVYPLSLVRRDERGRRYQDSGILAIVPESVDLSAHSQAIERCQFCGDARPGAKQNMILVDGVCPRCGKDRHGEVPDRSLKVTDEEVREFEANQKAS